MRGLKQGLWAVLGACGLFGAAAQAGAQGAGNYPNRTLRWIVGYTPGGTADMLARAVGAKLTEAWGQTVVVENRPGGATNIATELVARSAPDGYTLLLGTVANVINPSLQGKLNFDFARDFAHVTNMASTPGIVTVHPSVPAKNIKELVALAKSQPGKLTFGSAGSGTPQHMAGELFNTMAGIRIVHVPYKGTPAGLLDLIGGRLSALFGINSVVLPQARAGKVRAFAVTSLQRVTAAPELPTMAESGYPGFEATSWFALLGPAGTPAPIVRKLHQETVKALAAPDLRAKFAELGMDIVGGSPEELTAIIKRDIPKWAKVIKDAGAKLD